MSKRFTDTAIWDKQWYMKMSPGQKCAFNYIKDRCDSVGVWDANFELASYMIGEKVDWEALLSATNGNIEVLSNGKWFLVDFCAFQYGELRSECKPHASYLSLLRKHGLSERVCKGYRKSFYTAKEKEKEKEEEKEASRAAARLKKRMGVK